MVLLDVTFDGARRKAVGRELAELQARGVVSLGRDHRWRAQHRPLAPSSASAQRPVHSGNAPSDPLIASPATFTTKPIAADVVLLDDDSAASESELDPHASLRFQDPSGKRLRTGNDMLDPALQSRSAPHSRAIDHNGRTAARSAWHFEELPVSRFIGKGQHQAVDCRHAVAPVPRPGGRCRCKRSHAHLAQHHKRLRSQLATYSRDRRPARLPGHQSWRHPAQSLHQAPEDFLRRDLPKQRHRNHVVHHHVRGQRPAAYALASGAVKRVEHRLMRIHVRYHANAQVVRQAQSARQPGSRPRSGRPLARASLGGGLSGPALSIAGGSAVPP